MPKLKSLCIGLMFFITFFGLSNAPMKVKFLFFICCVSHPVFSQILVQTASGSQIISVSQAVAMPGANGPVMTYVAVPTGNAVRTNQSDLNKNSKTQEINIASTDRAIPASEKYAYDGFRDGQVIFSSGNQSRVVKMNYNQFFGEIQFINEKNDTLFIADADSAVFVRLENDLYRYHSKNGYSKVIAAHDQVSLTVQHRLKKIKQKKGETDYSVISRESLYYLFDLQGSVHKASKTGFLKTFPKQKQQIKGYLKQMTHQGRPIKFSMEADLIKLMRFCESLA